MTKEDIFQAWAPSSVVWCNWTKPMLFAQADLAARWSSESGVGDFDTRRITPADGMGAIIVDLPGAQSVAAGLALATKGYRPVPLYSGIAAPGATDFEIVDVRSIVAALVAGADAMAQMQLSGDAPPAFLLDANRRYGRGEILPGQFDNRSISLPTDFPSANFLLSRGIKHVTIVQPNRLQPQEDLAHTLRRWQEAGMVIFVQSLDDAENARECNVARPSGFRRIWHRFLATLGLKRNPFGGFGGRLPMPSAG